MKANEIDKKFDDGEDITEYLELGSAKKQTQVRTKTFKALAELRKSAIENDLTGMSLEEIDQEIQKNRAECFIKNRK